MAAHPGLQGFRRWILSTRDGHGLYAKTGYVPLEVPSRWMERRPIQGYSPPASDDEATARS